MATLDWIDEFFDSEEEAVEDPIAEAADDMDMEFPDLIDAPEEEPLEMMEMDDPIAEAAGEAANLDPMDDAIGDAAAIVDDEPAAAPEFGENVEAASEDPDFGEVAREDEATDFAELSDMQELLADKSDDMAQAMEADAAPDFAATAAVQEQETQDKKDLTGEPTLVQLAPGTRLTIEGLGDVSLAQGAPDAETA